MLRLRGMPSRLLVMWLCGTLAAPAGGNAYQPMFEALNRDMRERMAPALVRTKLAQSLLISNQYLASMTRTYEGLVAELAARARAIDTQVKTLSTLASQPSMDNYKAFLKEALQARLQTETARDRIETARDVAGALSDHGEFFDNYCASRVGLLHAPDTLGSLPQGIREDGSVYTRHNHVFSGRLYEGNVVSDDPVAEESTKYVFGVSVIAGVAIYAFLQGISFTAALGALSVSSSGGAILLGSATGVGLVIILAAVAVAVIVSVAITENENRKRKRKAEERFEREMNDFRAAREWYVANRLTEDEFRAKAREVCDSDEWRARIEESRSTLVGNVSEIQGSLTELDGMEKVLADNEARINGLADGMAEALIRIFSAEYVASVRHALIPVEKLNAAILYFNENIKPEQGRLAAYYAANRDSCFVLEAERDRVKAELEVKMALAVDSYRVPANQSDSFFRTELSSRTAAIVETLSKRVKRCFEDANQQPGFDPIFPEL